MKSLWKKCFIGLVVADSLAVCGMAAITNITWVGPTSGDALWEDAANWSPADVPNSGHSANGERAAIGDATGDRNIFTPATPTSIVGLSPWTQSSIAVNKITLSNNLTAAGYEDATWDNTSGNAANLVLDLNGHTFDRNRHYAPATTDGYTILSSAPGGLWRQRGFYAMNANTVIGSGVTLEAYVGGTSTLAGTWDPTSTFLVSPATHTAYTLPTAGVGYLVIGKTNNTFGTTLTGFISQSISVVQRDVTINTYDGATGGDASDFAWGVNNSINMDLRVGGNFYDAATDNSSYGGAPTNNRRRTITFNGGAGTQRTVSIGRTGLVNDFAVGDSSGGAGNVMLAQDLTTTGRFTLRGNSIFNVNTNTLTSGEFIGQSGLQLQYSFGAGDGLIDVDGPLTLPSSLTIDVTALEEPLAKNHVLFTFDSYVGPLDLSTWSFTGDVSPLWSAEFSGNSIILVPEPSVGCLGLCLLPILCRRCRGGKPRW